MTPQALNFPEGHPCAGMFKGMAYILEEHRLVKESKLHAECKNFKCAPPLLIVVVTMFCTINPTSHMFPQFLKMHAMLVDLGWYIFLNVTELNFIEQCWGYAKRIYWLNLPSSKEEVLERYALAALISISLAQMWQFVLFPFKKKFT